MRNLSSNNSVSRSNISSESPHCQNADSENLEHLYTQEPVGESFVPLCPHGNVPLSAIYNGELKAVHSIAAAKLIAEWNVHLKFVHSESKQASIDRADGVLTG